MQTLHLVFVVSVLTQAGVIHYTTDRYQPIRGSIAMSKTLERYAQKVNPKAGISAKAKLLVDTLVSKGCTITEASKLAGYKGNSARVSASKMLRKPEVQA